MIPFNVPPVTGKEEQYIAEAIASHKICGDGQFTKKCHDWFETHFFKGGGKKFYLQHREHLLSKWLLFYVI